MTSFKKASPPGIFEILRIPGLGPKKVAVIWGELGIASLGELENACRESRLSDLAGFGGRTQEKILLGIQTLKKHRERFHCDVALQEAEGLLEALRDHPDTVRICVAGSIRRRCETSKDIDLVISSEKASSVMRAFVSLDRVDQLVAQGETKSSIRMASGMVADLRVVSDLEFPFALHHFTGSKEHNVALRARAVRQGLKMNEYGLFDGEKPIPCRNEEEIFSHLGLSFIPPELREGTGEIEAAQQGELPGLVEMKDLRRSSARPYQCQRWLGQPGGHGGGSGQTGAGVHRDLRP